MKDEPLVRIDVVERFLRHQRAFVETRQYQLELAGIPIDIADGEDPGHARFECRRVDQDILPVLHLHAPVADGPQLHGEAKKREQGVAGDLEIRAVVALDDGFRDLPGVAFYRRDLTKNKIDLALAYERHHFVDAVGRCPKLAAPMQEREVLCEWREGDGPVQRRVAAANDQEALVAKGL